MFSGQVIYEIKKVASENEFGELQVLDKPALQFINQFAYAWLNKGVSAIDMLIAKDHKQSNDLLVSVHYLNEGGFDVLVH